MMQRNIPVGVKDLLERHHETSHSLAESSIGAEENLPDPIKYVSSVSTLDDYFCIDMAMKRFAQGKSTVSRSVDLVLEDSRNVSETIHAMYPTWTLVQTPGYSTYLLAVDNENQGVVFMNTRNRGLMRLNVCGSTEWVDKTMKNVLTRFTESSSFIEWVYSPDGDSVRVPLNTDRLPRECMYPWLNGRKLKDYYEAFMDSSANILLLLGVPGSGKTTFIRGLLHETKSSASVTYDPNILTRDSFFADFLESEDTSVIVLEDADNFMRSRAEGNDMMHRFLNLGDGLVSTSRKKLVFSSNLPSLRDVDSALLRPGRCFDMVEFSDLNSEQAYSVAKEFGMSRYFEKGKRYTLAEVLSGGESAQSPVTSRSKFGFTPAG